MFAAISAIPMICVIFYMYLKTYAKFTFCIKFQGNVSDENFLYYCITLYNVCAAA